MTFFRILVLKTLVLKFRLKWSQSFPIGPNFPAEFGPNDHWKDASHFISVRFFQAALKGPNNLNSDEDEESAEEESQPKATKKRKKLNSSDEEWAPKKKKKQEKKKSRKLSSSEDDMREMDEANMSDAVDEDYSDSEVTVKRSATVEKAIHKFLQTASNSELQTVDTISGTFDHHFLKWGPDGHLVRIPQGAV